jgi:hypothetical protein
MVEWQVRGTGLYYPVQPHAATILAASIQHSLYHPPQDLIDSYQTVPVSQPLPSLTGEVSYSIDTIVEGPSSWLITGWVMPQGLLQSFASPQLVLHSAQETLFFPVRPVARIDVVQHFWALRAARSGFALLIQKPELKSREYQLGILDPTPGKARFVMTDRVLKVDSLLSTRASF